MIRADPIVDGVNEEVEAEAVTERRGRVGAGRVDVVESMAAHPLFFAGTGAGAVAGSDPTAIEDEDDDATGPNPEDAQPDFFASLLLADTIDAGAEPIAGVGSLTPAAPIIFFSSFSSRLRSFSRRRSVSPVDAFLSRSAI